MTSGSKLNSPHLSPNCLTSNLPASRPEKNGFLKKDRTLSYLISPSNSLTPHLRTPFRTRKRSRWKNRRTSSRKPRQQTKVSHHRKRNKYPKHNPHPNPNPNPTLNKKGKAKARTQRQGNRKRKSKSRRATHHLSKKAMKWVRKHRDSSPSLKRNKCKRKQRKFQRILKEMETPHSSKNKETLVKVQRKKPNNSRTSASWTDWRTS